MGNDDGIIKKDVLAKSGSMAKNIDLAD